MTGNYFSPNAGDSIIVRLKIDRQGQTLAKITTKIAELSGILGAIDIVRPISKEGSIRDFSIYTNGPEHADKIVGTLRAIKGVELIQHSDRTFLLHHGGKIEVTNKQALKTREDLSMAYTPGVGKVCTAIHKNPDDVYKLTIKKNTVAIVTDGTAVLGLGNIGPMAALPVMEGKAMLFKDFADVDAFPICLDTKNAEEAIQVVKAIAPGFGGINLEDIAAPQCFEIENRLKEELDIPVFHDDQHGTAVVVTAALINALELLNKNPEEIKVIILGAGAAGTACAKMIQKLNVSNIIACDRKGAIHSNRGDLNEAKLWFSQNTNPKNETGGLSDVISGADVFLGLSGPGLLKVDDVKKMGKDAIVFAMANPTPEIMPEEAAPHVAIMATGRSDYPNQINNVLCFPGIFRGALDCLAKGINEDMKMAAARAIADCVPKEHLQPEYIIPSALNQEVVKVVSKAVIQSARKTGMARKRGRKIF